MAPAAGLLPSMPSVPALSTVMASPEIFAAQARANCWLRPPVPPFVDLDRDFSAGNQADAFGFLAQLAQAFRR